MALDVTSIALSGVVAVGSSILTNWLSPKFGHAIWKRQRIEERRLAAISSLIKLTGEFYQGWMKANLEAQRGWQPSMDWYVAKYSVDVEIEALFSPDSYRAYKELEKRFDPELGAIEGRPSQSAFEQAYTNAYRRLYAEVFG